MIDGTGIFDGLPIAVYATDCGNRITYYNEAAARLWGEEPAIGSRVDAGSWRLYWLDGRPMRPDECCMSASLREGRPLEAVETMLQRADGSRVFFFPYPRLLRDTSGEVTGAVNLLVESTDRQAADIESARLAAIVASSEDAIVSKSLDGRVTSWNAGAARIFGYQPEEMIGQSIKRIIPVELHGEEDDILARLSCGKRIDHFDTVRLTKEGRRIDISLTVSPIRDRRGNVIGASKVARDVTARKRDEELQRLLLDELNHRVKNTLAIIQAIANQTLRRAPSPADFVESFSGRIQALARSHNLLVERRMRCAELMEIVREQVVLDTADRTRISCSGPLVELDGRTALHLGLVLHELATNARKHGALKVPTGQLSIRWDVVDGAGKQLALEWQESGVPGVKRSDSRGFGTTLIERTASGNGGKAELSYAADGLVCRITLPLPQQQPDVVSMIVGQREERAARGPEDATWLRGKKVLLVEDEPLVALEIEAHLLGLGCEIVGPAATVAAARELIETYRCDAALLDANLGGSRVDELAARLGERGVPFAFATGYGREAAPARFADTPVLNKPFSTGELLSILRTLMEGGACGISDASQTAFERRVSAPDGR